MKFFPWDFQNFSLGNGKSKIPFSLGIPMMGIPRAETLFTMAFAQKQKFVLSQQIFTLCVVAIGLTVFYYVSGVMLLSDF